MLLLSYSDDGSLATGRNEPKWRSAKRRARFVKRYTRRCRSGCVGEGECSLVGNYGNDGNGGSWHRWWSDWFHRCSRRSFSEVTRPFPGGNVCIGAAHDSPKLSPKLLFCFVFPLQICYDAK